MWILKSITCPFNPNEPKISESKHLQPDLHHVSWCFWKDHLRCMERENMGPTKRERPENHHFQKVPAMSGNMFFFPSEGIFGLCLINVPPLFDRRFLTEKSAWGHQPLSFPWVRCTYLWTHGGIPPDELIRWMDSALTGVFWRLLMSPWVRLGGGVGSDFCYT